MLRGFARLFLLSTALGVLAGCGSHRASQAAAQPEAEETRTPAAHAPPDPSVAKDRAILAARGTRRYSLDYLAARAPAAPAPMRIEGKNGRDAVGLFSLGMTPDEVRRRARAAAIYNSDAHGGWCDPPAEGAPSPVIIREPASISLNDCKPDVCTSYTIWFAPVGTAVRATTIARTRNKSFVQIEAASRMLSRLHLKSAQPAGQCVLTSAEDGLIDAHGSFETNPIQDRLHDQVPAEDRLPPVIQAALRDWAQQAKVKPNADCCDVPWRNVSFNGAWVDKGDFVISYTVWIGGFAVHSACYVVVFDGNGHVLWSGLPADFAKDGLHAPQTDLAHL